MIASVSPRASMVTDPWLDLALSYAPNRSRAALDALFTLDAALGNVLRTTREPLVGQMRLAWWREALQGLDASGAPAEPVLQSLASAVLPLGIEASALSGTVDAWEPLLGDIGNGSIDEHARLRGRALFIMAGGALGAAADDPVGDAGEGWALADLAANLSDPSLASRAREEAAAKLTAARRSRWSRNGRALGALALIADRQLSGPIPPTFVLRLARFRLSGR
ncbi:squalene/phytoene synthase family protein [Sphingomonas pruni]|uniref:squalene/phytoene synthase family protein n=1 Tax=Sphingomonas pruni TaxID=40683 RepID=UPI000A64CA7A|nr:squalene/phytoene synthase family protein [Sphingomonas pruni]